MGTIGGTLAHGDPASDLPAILLAHEGSVIVRGPGGEREVAGGGLLRGLPDDGRSAEDEILTEVRLPALEGYGYGYEKFNRRQEDWAMVAVCALVKKGGDGTCADVRIGLTHMGSMPLRATAVEEALRGQPLTADTIAAAAEHAAEGTEPPADLNASAGLQAPPGAGAAQAGADGRVTMTGEFRNSAGRVDGPGRRGLPRRPGPRHVRLPRLRARAAAAAGGRGGRGQDRGGARAGVRDGRRADPPAVPRGHRPPPRGLRLGLPAPAAGDPGGRGGRAGARAVRAGVPAAPAAAGGAGARGRARPCC